MKHTKLFMSLLLSGTMLGCASAPTSSAAGEPTFQASADQPDLAQATGQLALRLANQADRHLLAFAEDLKCLEVTLLRQNDSDEWEAIGSTKLEPDAQLKFEVINLLPGQYKLAVVAYDRADRAVQESAPGPYLVGPYPVRAYEIAYVDLDVPLKPTWYSPVAFPAPDADDEPKPPKKKKNKKNPSSGPTQPATDDEGDD